MHSGTITAAEAMARQLTALESINVLVIIGANGPSAQDLNQFVGAVPVMGSLGRFIQSLTGALAAESPAYQYDSQTGNIAIPVAEVIQLRQGLQGAAQAMNCLFDEMEKHQVSGAIGEDAFSRLDDLARAEYIVEAWDAFVQDHPDISDTAKSATRQAGIAGQYPQSREPFPGNRRVLARQPAAQARRAPVGLEGFHHPVLALRKPQGLSVFKILIPSFPRKNSLPRA